MSGGIVAKRYKNINIDFYPNGEFVIYEPEGGKIKCEGKVKEFYETTQ